MESGRLVRIVRLRATTKAAVAVEEAVKDFGSQKDFTIWAWYANRIGVNSFLELYFEQKSIMQTCTLRNPAAAFHARLKRFYAALKEGGAR